VEDEDFFDEDQADLERGFWNRKSANQSDGRSVVTGY
jgi:hypothetical protein